MPPLFQSLPPKGTARRRGVDASTQRCDSRHLAAVLRYGQLGYILTTTAMWHPEFQLQSWTAGEGLEGYEMVGPSHC